MRKRLIVLGGALLVLAIIGLVSLFARGGADPCRKLLDAVQKGDFDGSYSLLTDQAKTFITADQWNGQAELLKSVYGDTEPKLLGQPTPTTDPLTGAVTGQTIAYGIEHGGSRYKATCTLTNEQPKKVDSFSSRVGF